LIHLLSKAHVPVACDVLARNLLKCLGERRGVPPGFTQRRKQALECARETCGLPPSRGAQKGKFDRLAPGSMWRPIHVTIHMDDIWLLVSIPLDVRNEMTMIAGRAPDAEKITINLGLVDLGQIDLLVQEGFYSNRTDFIRTAIRNHLATHGDIIRETVGRKTLVLGLVEFTRSDLEGVKKSGKRLRVQVLGLARIAPDVSVALALATIDSVSVLGAFQASPAVKAALADRIH
jgi:Arc/MetJ-type ribon-helix-helix transcriptional regulator